MLMLRRKHNGGKNPCLLHPSRRKPTLEYCERLFPSSHCIAHQIATLPMIRKTAQLDSDHNASSNCLIMPNSTNRLFSLLYPPVSIFAETSHYFKHVELVKSKLFMILCQEKPLFSAVRLESGIRSKFASRLLLPGAHERKRLGSESEFLLALAQ